MSKYTILALVLLLFTAGCIRKNEPIKKKPAQSDETQMVFESPIINEVLFAGVIEKKHGLYKYNIANKEISKFWQNDKEDVVELRYSPKKKAVFFLTALQSGKKGVFPFIDKVKLFFINPPNDSVKFIENIGSGLQVFAFWENENAFKVLLNIMDVTIGKTVEQKTKIYDTLGNKISDEKKVYDLAKDGYPTVPAAPLNLTSSNQKYSLLAVDSAQAQMYLVDHRKNNEQILLTKQHQKLKNAEWSSDGKFLIFTTLDISPMNETLYDAEPNTSKLFIYSLPNKRMVKIFEGGGIKNILLNGELLFFDDGFNEKSKIFIYDLRLEQIIETIIIKGGCGLQNIPAIPDYGA